MAGSSSTDDISQLVRRVHTQGVRLVLAVTGGGSGALSALVGTAGASRSILEAHIPYSPAALADFLGAIPEHACHPRTARALAMRAYQRALALDLRLEPPHLPVAGIGCTASLASDRPKRGAHRVHVAAQTREFSLTCSLELAKGRRSREQEERLATRLVLNLVAAAAGLTESLDLALSEPEHVETLRTEAPKSWQELLSGARSAVRELPHNEAAQAPLPRALFPGAFHPLHRAHRRMAEIAEHQLQVPVEFEISVFNVDKPPLDYTELRHRAAQFSPNDRLWFTAAPTFREKARLFPGTTFVIGADTLVRLVDPAYYGHSAVDCQAALSEIAQAGCHFLVFGRRFGDRFCTLPGLDLPAELAACCQEIAEYTFRDDISSTELRRQHPADNG